MWLVFFVPTLLIGLDFVYLTLKSKRMLIDHAHYFAQYMWVLANAVWAGGEFWFTPNNDSAIPVSRFSSEARHTSRWYSSWVVLGAYIPLAALYVLWIYHTYFGIIPPVKSKTVDSDRDVYYDSDASVRHSEAELSGNSAPMVANPLVPMREVSIQPTNDVSGQSGSTAASRNTFVISTSGSQKPGNSRHTTGNLTENTEIRLSDLSASDSVIQGAEV